MVTGARSRWGREEGGPTCRLEAGSGTDKPPPQRCVGLGRARALGIGADQRPGSGELTAGSGHGGTPGAWRLRVVGDKVPRGEGCRVGDIGDDWGVLKPGGNCRGSVSRVERRNRRQGGGVPRGGPSGSVAGAWEKERDIRMKEKGSPEAGSWHCRRKGC